MADWYVSSVTWAALSPWTASTAYTVGQFIRPSSLTTSYPLVYRCTTAGTTGTGEPNWQFAQGDGNTQNDGTAVWTNVAGRSAYGWTAAAGTFLIISSSRPVAGDRVFLSSDHVENVSGNQTLSVGGAAGFGVIEIISVNRAGSVPPVAADITSGAAIGATSNFLVDAVNNLFFQGITLTGGSNFAFQNSQNKTQYYKNCTVAWGSSLTSNIVAKIIFDNSAFKFPNTSQHIGGGNNFDFSWINTSSPFSGSNIPSTLITAAGSNLMTFRGVDLSAVTGTLLNTPNSAEMCKVLLDSCKIASGVTRYTIASGSAPPADELELINCFDGTNILNERYMPTGAVTTDRSTYLTGGAQDDVGNYALKMATSANSDKFTFPLTSFPFDVENTAIGAAKTATVEIISSGSLNNDDISLLLEYMGTSGSSVASFVSSLPTVLTAGSALTSSSSTWNNPPGTPQKQLLQVTFTPQVAGRVRGQVRLGKPSTTIWVNPQVTIT